MRNPKGFNHLSTADAFIAAFPMGSIVDLETMDDHMVSQGLCQPVGLRDTTNPTYVAQQSHRDSFRRNVNAGGACTDRPVSERFNVRVSVFGVNYQVVPLAEQVLELCDNVPHKIASTVARNASLIDYYYDNADRDGQTAVNKMMLKLTKYDTEDGMQQISDITERMARKQARTIALIEESLGVAPSQRAPLKLLKKT